MPSDIDIIQAGLKNCEHMVIRKGIKEVFSLTAKFDQTHPFQNPKLVGSGALRPKFFKNYNIHFIKKYD